MQYLQKYSSQFQDLVFYFQLFCLQQKNLTRVLDKKSDILFNKAPRKG